MIRPIKLNDIGKLIAGDKAYISERFKNENLEESLPIECDIRDTIMLEKCKAREEEKDKSEK